MISLVSLYHTHLSANKTFVKELKSIIGYSPKNINPFITAFTFVKHNKKENFEKLEFLGDSVLNLVVAECLYKKYPKADEGFLTKLRSKMVSRDHLNEIGEKMQLDILLNLQNPPNHTLPKMGDILEALVGAIHIDSDFVKTRKIIQKQIIKNYMDIEALEVKETDSKSKLMEWGQKEGKAIVFEMIEDGKTKRSTMFKVVAKIDEKAMGTGVAISKKKAEQIAAAEAMQTLLKT